MASAKEFVIQILDSLPDDCSVEDIQYELYVRQAIQKGEDAAEKNQALGHEEVIREMAEWLRK